MKIQSDCRHNNKPENDSRLAQKWDTRVNESSNHPHAEGIMCLTLSHEEISIKIQKFCWNFLQTRLEGSSFLLYLGQKRKSNQLLLQEQLRQTIKSYSHKACFSICERAASQVFMAAKSHSRDTYRRLIHGWIIPIHSDVSEKLPTVLKKYTRVEAE